jgi:hypothetical protein
MDPRWLVQSVVGCLLVIFGGFEAATGRWLTSKDYVAPVDPSVVRVLGVLLLIAGVAVIGHVLRYGVRSRPPR